MVLVDNTNIERAKKFIKGNLKRSGFMYGNLLDSSAVSYILELGDEIVAMTNVLEDKYCTYLFPKDTPELIVRETIEFMADKKHTGGTVIGDYYHIFKDYYKLSDNAINEVASLEVTNNQFQSEYAEYLTQEDIKAYKQALDTITEFEYRTMEAVEESFKRSVTVGIKSGDTIVSAATLTAISDISAVVTGVFTIRSEEGKGYAKDCLGRLLKDYGSNRTILIFFTNPVAKQLYLNLGFEVEDKLIMYGEKISE